MKYVQSMVMPVPKKKLDDYRRTNRKFGKLYLEYGALEFADCVGDDIEPGELTSFPQSVALKRTETVVLSWIVFKSRAHRDKVLPKVMGDPRAKKLMNKKDMPIDGKRMFWGGFEVMTKL